MADDVQGYQAAPPEQRIAARRAAEQQLSQALARWLALVNLPPAVGPTEHVPPIPWRYGGSFWALALVVGLILYGIGLPIVLDAAPSIDLRLAWNDPAVWPLDLLAQEWFGLLAVVAGVGMFAETLRLLHRPFWRIAAWHLALLLTANVALYAAVAMVETHPTLSGRPLVTLVTFTALTLLIVLRIYGGAGFAWRVPVAE